MKQLGNSLDATALLLKCKKQTQHVETQDEIRTLIMVSVCARVFVELVSQSCCQWTNLYFFIRRVCHLPVHHDCPDQSRRKESSSAHGDPAVLFTSPSNLRLGHQKVGSLVGCGPLALLMWLHWTAAFPNMKPWQVWQDSPSPCPAHYSMSWGKWKKTRKRNFWAYVSHSKVFGRLQTYSLLLF